jgi:DNA repair ATPase RecN
MDIVKLEQTINATKEKFLQDKGKYENFLAMKKAKEESIANLKKKHEKLDKARIFLIKSGEYQRQQIKTEFENMVTQALQYIMEEDICFEIDIQEVRGRAEAEFYIKSIRDGVATRTSISESRGDGISDVVGLALNVAQLECTNPKNNGPLILDEPAKQVSAKHIDNIGRFLKDLSEAFNRQIIVITHIRKLGDMADAKFDVELNGTVSEVTSATTNPNI